jgi:RHS repeat-associated protein
MVKNSGPGGIKQLVIEWNRDNEPYIFQDATGVQTNVRYDATGQRVFQSHGNDVRLYFGDYLDVAYSATGGPIQTTQYYYAGPLLIARKDSTGTYWYHQDHLGSTRIMTDQSGAVVARYDYKPFGDTINKSGTLANDIQFTGHRVDAGIGLVNMGARYYDSLIDRFISPDPSIPSSSNPQSLNRYSYTYNNPLSYIDRGGYQPEPSSTSSNKYLWAAHNWMIHRLVMGASFVSGAQTAEAEIAETELFPLIYTTLTDPGGAIVKGLENFIPAVSKAYEKNGFMGVVDMLNPADEALIYTYLASEAWDRNNYMQAGYYGEYAWNSWVQTAVAAFGLEQLGKSILNPMKSSTKALRVRGNEIHSVLDDPIAIEQRTTAVIRAYDPKTKKFFNVVAGGAKRDLSPAQRLAIQPGEVAAKLPGADAEMTALEYIRQQGWVPVAGATTRAVCPICGFFMEMPEAWGGATWVNENEFLWLEWQSYVP